MRCDRSTRDCCDRRRSLPSSSFPYPCGEYSFYLCRKGVRSFLVHPGEKGILFLYNALLQRRENSNHTNHKKFGFFLSGGVKKFLRIHFRVVVRTPAGLKHKHTHNRTRLTTERYYTDGEEDEREEIADGWWCRWWWCGETETLHEHGKQNERKRARELAKKRGDRETIENVQTTTDTR